MFKTNIRAKRNALQCVASNPQLNFRGPSSKSCFLFCNPLFISLSLSLHLSLSLSSSLSLSLSLSSIFCIKHLIPMVESGYRTIVYYIRDSIPTYVVSFTSPFGKTMALSSQLTNGQRQQCIGGSAGRSQASAGSQGLDVSICPLGKRT